jgi:hypothetical protein
MSKNRKQNDMDSRLYGAIANGNEAEVRKLIGASRDPVKLLNAQSNIIGAGVNGNAVTLAASLGHVGMIKLLRENGAIVEEQAAEVVKDATQAKPVVNPVKDSKKKGMFSGLNPFKRKKKVVPASGGVTGFVSNMLGGGNRPTSSNSEQSRVPSSPENKVKQALKDYVNPKDADSQAAAKDVINNYKEGPPLAGIINEGYYLSKAAGNGDLEAVKFFQEKGASIDYPSLSKQTALMAAVEKGYSDVTVYLVQQKAELNRQDGKGETALMKEVNRIADLPKDKEVGFGVVILLIQNGADTSLTNKAGNTALTIAKEKLGKDSPVFKEMKDAFREAKSEIGANLMSKRLEQIMSLGQNTTLNEDIAKQKAQFNQIGKSIREAGSISDRLPWTPKVKGKDEGHEGR